MSQYIASIILGVVCVIIGINNMRGNISSIRYHHRKRVSEEDRIPYGKKVGIGTIIMGISLSIFGAALHYAQSTQNNTFVFTGTAVLIGGMVIGLAFCIYAMIKYNKGIF